MAKRVVVAIGASAGGIGALTLLLPRLPPSLSASLLITLHLSPHHRSELDAILSETSALPVSFAKDGESLERGRAYLAPPDRHLLIVQRRLHLGSGPRENFSRPAIDPMMRSVALSFGPLAIGVLLTGTLSDGSVGLAVLARHGAACIVQDPKDAAYPDMPLNALNANAAYKVVPLSEMPDLLAALVEKEMNLPIKLPDDQHSNQLRFETRVALGERPAIDTMDKHGQRSTFSCPICKGTLWEVGQGNTQHFRCHTGHAFSMNALNDGIDGQLADALDVALRLVDEKIAMLQSLEDRAVQSGSQILASSWQEKKKNYEERRAILRDAMRRLNSD